VSPLGSRQGPQRDREPARHEDHQAHKPRKLPNHRRQRQQDHVALEHRDRQPRQKHTRRERERLETRDRHFLVVGPQAADAEGEVSEEVDEEDRVEQVERPGRVGRVAVLAHGGELVQGEAEAEQDKGTLDQVDPVNLVVELDEHKEDQDGGEGEVLDPAPDPRHAQEMVVQPGMFARLPVVHFHHRTGLKVVLQKRATEVPEWR
jgi:hypothetical protein